MKRLFTTLKNVFLVACVLIALFAVVGYAAGWVKFHHDEQQDTTTIEVDRGEIEKDVKGTVDKGEKMIDDAVNGKEETDEPTGSTQEESSGDSAASSNQ